MILQITIWKYSISMRMYLNMMRNFMISLFSGCMVGMTGFFFGIIGEPQDWGLRLKLYYIFNELILLFQLSQQQIQKKFMIKEAYLEKDSHHRNWLARCFVGVGVYVITLKFQLLIARRNLATIFINLLLGVEFERLLYCSALVFNINVGHCAYDWTLF